MSCPVPPLSLSRTAASQNVPGRHALPLPETPTLSEVFSRTAMDGAGPAFVLAALGAPVPADRSDPGAAAAPRGPVLWVQDRTSLRETGRPYLAGLAAAALPEMLHLTVGRAADVLWAMEQGLGCPALSAVVGEIWGEAQALDFTATKRLALRAEAQGVPVWLIRRAARPDLSAARMRWHLASAPSERLEDDPRAPGLPRWTAELFRARGLRPGVWTVRYDPARHTMAFTAPPTGHDAEGGAEEGAALRVRA